MKDTNLLILPGGSNPQTELYKKVYNVISSAAKERYIYKEVYGDVRWPGQFAADTYEDAPFKTFTASVEVAAKAIHDLAHEPFDILARSYGCNVALYLASQKIWEKAPRKMMLWGPSPYWKYWRMWVRDVKENQQKFKEKGLKIDHTFFRTLEPIEALITDVNIPTVVAAGTEDSMCDLHFFRYLQAIVEANEKSKRNERTGELYVKFSMPVNGAKHEVTDDDGKQIVDDYVKALFES